MKKFFEELNRETKNYLAKEWLALDESEKELFLDMISLFISILKDDDKSREILLIIIEQMSKEDAKLTSFPKYVEWFLNVGKELYSEKVEKLKKLLLILQRLEKSYFKKI